MTITFANAQMSGSIKALNPVEEGFIVSVSANVNFEDRNATRQAQQEGILRAKSIHEPTYTDAKASLASELDALETALGTFVSDWNANQDTTPNP